MIQKRFDNLQPYLKGVKISENFSIVESMLKSRWTFSQILPDNVQVETKEIDTKDMKYHLFYSDEKTIDELIDILENIINKNIEIEKKEELLRTKVDELKRMFEEKPLDELVSLKFSSNIDVTLNIKKDITENENTKNNVSTEKV